MASAGTLIFELAADVSHLRADMAKAQSEISASLESIRKSSAAEALMSGAEYAAEFARGFAEKISQAIEQADALGKLAERIGTTTEELSALQYAGSFAGVGVDNLTDALKGMSKALVDARDPNSNAAVAIRALGLNVATLQSQDPAKTFRDIAQAMSGFENGNQKIAVARELFGKFGDVLIPMLNSGKAGLDEMTKEAENFGLIVSGDTAKAMADLNDDIQRLKNLSTGAATVFARELKPAFDTLIDIMRDASKEGTVWNSVLEGIATTAKQTASILVGLAGIMATFTSLAQKFEDLNKAGFDPDKQKAARAAMIADWNKQRDVMTQIYATQQKITSGDKDRVSLTKGAQKALDDLAATADKAGKKPLPYIAGLDQVAQNAKKAKKEVDEFAKMMDDLNAKMVALKSNGDPMAEMLADPKFQKLSADRQETLKKTMSTYLDMKGMIELDKQAQADLDKQYEQGAQAQANYTKSLEDMTSSQLDAIDPLRVNEREMAQYNDALERGIVNQDQFNQLVKASNKRFDDAYKGITPMTEQTKALTDAIEGFGQTAADSFMDFATGADNMADSFRKMIADMLTQLAKMLVYQYVFKGLFSSVSSGFGSLMSSAGGAAGGFSSPASMVPANYASPVGLLGAPATTATDGGGSTGGGGGGGAPGSNVVVNVHMTKEQDKQDTTADSATARELGTKIAAVVRQVISTEKRTGGLLAPSPVGR